MRLYEFLDSNQGMMDSLRQTVMDYLTPLVARKVSEISIQNIEDTLRSYDSGLTIDRGLMMELIDPDKMKLVKKITGDKIYLNALAAMNSASTQEDKEKQADKLSDKATKQAKKEITK
jgi:hypothetical protein